MKKERRDFLKMTAAGAAGLALTRATPARAAWPDSGKIEINPDISNMRVVACVDTAMMKSVPTSMTFQTQNAAVDTARVQANMDAMAMTLAQKGSAEEAWKTIFRSSKDWPATVVAVKVNGGEAKNTAHLAVLQKLSNLLVGWGVKPENFIVYDGHTMGTTGIFKSSFSTTDKSKVIGVMGGTTGSSEDLLGGWANAKLVDGSTRRCAAKIADGTVDILINIANNKGHAYGTDLGNVTLCMKNHFGTWEPDSTHTDLANLIFKMNKSDPIIGGTPPRQQLCIVDSLFCNKADITGSPELMPCTLVMGTFAPAVDYLTVKKIREEVSKLKHDAKKIDAYLTSFGYTSSDPQWILVPAAGSGADAGVGGSGGAGGSSGAGTGRSGGNSGSSDASSSAGSGGVGSSGGASGGMNGGGSSDSRVASGGRSSGGASRGGSSAGERSQSGGAGGASSQASLGGMSGAGGRSDSEAGPSGSGGSRSSGGAASTSDESGPAASAKSGCACDVGGHALNFGGLGAMLVAGTLVAGKLQQLLHRRETVANSCQSVASTQQDHAPVGDEPNDSERTQK